MLAYLVLLRVEVAAFHPACPALANGNKRTRLCGPIPRLHRELAPTAYNGRVLPATLLCGARTFLYVRHRRLAAPGFIRAQRLSGQLRGRW